MRYTPEYAVLQSQLHTNPEYGTSGQRYTQIVEQLIAAYQTKDILDYGAGKGTLQKSLPFPIQNYDPFIPEYCNRPTPATIVVCTDVMEHIELDCLRDVLVDLHSLTKTVLFTQIATGPARKFLSDGRNAHLIQENVNWWVPRMMEFFHLQSMQNQDNLGFIAIWTPINPEEKSDEQPS